MGLRSTLSHPFPLPPPPSSFSLSLFLPFSYTAFSTLIHPPLTPPHILTHACAGNPNEYTIDELARTIATEVVPGAAVTYVSNTPDDPRKRRPDITRAKELLGWKPRTQLVDGLSMMAVDFAGRLGVPCAAKTRARASHAEASGKGTGEGGRRGRCDE